MVERYILTGGKHLRIIEEESGKDVAKLSIAFPPYTKFSRAVAYKGKLYVSDTFYGIHTIENGKLVPVLYGDFIEEIYTEPFLDFTERDLPIAFVRYSHSRLNYVGSVKTGKIEKIDLKFDYDYIMSFIPDGKKFYVHVLLKNREKGSLFKIIEVEGKNYTEVYKDSYPKEWTGDYSDYKEFDIVECWRSERIKNQIGIYADTVKIGDLFFTTGSGKRLDVLGWKNGILERKKTLLKSNNVLGKIVVVKEDNYEIYVRGDEGALKKIVVSEDLKKKKVKKICRGCGMPLGVVYRENLERAGIQLG